MTLRCQFKNDTWHWQERRDSKLFSKKIYPTVVSNETSLNPFSAKLLLIPFAGRKKASNDWFGDQDEKIQRLLKDKKLRRNELRQRNGALKNRWFKEKVEEAKHFTQMKNHREFYATVNKVCGPKSKNCHTVKSKNGTILSFSQDIKNRWMEHFHDLLNQPTEVDSSILDQITHSYLLTNPLTRQSPKLK